MTMVSQEIMNHAAAVADVTMALDNCLYEMSYLGVLADGGFEFNKQDIDSWNAYVKLAKEKYAELENLMKNLKEL